MERYIIFIPATGKCSLIQCDDECPATLETLLLPASAAYQHFSSSMAREMIRYHQPLENYLPASIVPLVREMTEKKEG